MQATPKAGHKISPCCHYPTRVRRPSWRRRPSASVTVVATKAAGRWTIEFLSVELRNRDPKETLVLIDERNADRFEEF